MNRFTSNFNLKAIPRQLQALLVILILGALLTGMLFRKLAPWIALYPPELAPGALWGWQLFTYPAALDGSIGWSSLLSLACQLWLLCLSATHIIEFKGIKSFFILWFASSFICATAALAAMPWSKEPLLGPSCILFSLFATWAWTQPKNPIRLFPGIEINAATLLLGLFGIDSLIRIAQLESVQLSANASGLLFGWVYLKLSNWNWTRKPNRFRHSKIYDIQSGKAILNDDQFIDAMLSRISLYGEQTLTPEEKDRLRKISEQRLIK